MTVQITARVSHIDAVVQNMLIHHLQHLSVHNAACNICCYSSARSSAEAEATAEHMARMSRLQGGSCEISVEAKDIVEHTAQLDGSTPTADAWFEHPRGGDD
jgi:hypothetical protein